MGGYVKCESFSGFVVVALMVAFTVSFSVSITDPRDVAAMNSLCISLNNPPLQGWVPSGGDPCGDQWQGVNCVFFNITSLKLPSMNLGGTLANDLELFASVIEIDLSNNHIGGSIPSSLPLTIRSLSLAGNQLNGSIPDTLSSLTQLVGLVLNNNLLSGEIPDAFQLLTSLTNLDLSGNNLSGQLPPSMGNLSALTTLHLQNNKISKTLDVLQDLLLLQDLNIENNQFWGPIPPKLLNIPNFRKDGNPFNTTVIAFPPIAIPPSVAAPPTSAEAPSGMQFPADGRPSASETTKSQQSKKFFTNERIIWSAALAVVIFVALGVCLLIYTCCKRRQAEEVSEKHERGVYEAHAEKVTDKRQNNQEKGLEVNLMVSRPTPPPPPCPHVEKVVANPVLPAELYTRSSSTKRPESSCPVRIFSIATLQLYTNSFSEENFVGEGTLGSVYKVELPDGELLAVKKLNSAMFGQQTDEEFLQVVYNISKVKHPNIVELRGCCYEHGQRLLVYEYCKTTLHDALHVDDEIHEKLTWNTRISLALGAARAIQYMHEVCQPPIVHQNFKSANILLDGKLTARVSDCGLTPSKSSGSTSELSERFLSTYGYGAPELELGSYTCKSDVYSFGVMMLELLTGRKSYDRSRNRREQSLVRWAIPQLHDIDALSGMVDPSLNGAYPVKSVSRFADIISRCVQWEPEFRPPISEIVQDLLQMV